MQVIDGGVKGYIVDINLQYVVLIWGKVGLRGNFLDDGTTCHADKDAYSDGLYSNT